jgi:Protein of unknown function (DUF2934)
MTATVYEENQAAGRLPLEERVRQRAYELYVQRGNASGSEFDDWIQAEEEVVSAQDQQR